MNQHILEQKIQEAKKSQFDYSKLNTSYTKLGPSLHKNGCFIDSSWSPEIPISESYLTKIKLLEEKYESIFWLPLDIPKIQIDDWQLFLEIWEREKIAIIKKDDTSFVQEFYGMHIASNPLIDFYCHDLYDSNGKMTENQISDKSGFTQGRDNIGTYTKKLYKDRFFNPLVSSIMKFFPISVINSISIFEVMNDVAPHREETWCWKCPTEFRITLYDENSDPTIYLTDIETAKTKYIELPTDTNSFCWSNGTKLYGIDYHGKKNFQLVVNAIWNTTKLDKLLSNSLKKYG